MIIQIIELSIWGFLFAMIAVAIVTFMCSLLWQGKIGGKLKDEP
jgi:hypothetical protein